MDKEDGTYDVRYIAKLPGPYHISVKHLDFGEKSDWAHVRGSPFRVMCHDPWTRYKVFGQLPPVKKHAVLHHMAGDLVLCGTTDSGVHLCETQDSVMRAITFAREYCRGQEWRWSYEDVSGATPPDLSKGVLTSQTNPWGSIYFGQGAFVFDSEQKYTCKLADGGSGLVWETPNEMPQTW